MDINSLLWYIQGHETSRKPCATGEAPPPSHPVARAGHDFCGGSKMYRLFDKFPSPMATGFSQERRSRFGPKTSAWSSSEAFSCPKTKTGRSIARRTSGFGLFHKPLDNAPRGRGNPSLLWDSLSFQPSLAGASGVGMELPEAGTTGPGKGRRGDRALEEETMAGHKKKRSHLAPIWLFWMKAASCSFLFSGGHGRRGGRRLWCVMSTAASDFRSFRRLRFLPSADTGGFTSRFKSGISRAGMW